MSIWKKYLSQWELLDLVAEANTDLPKERRVTMASAEEAAARAVEDSFEIKEEKAAGEYVRSELSHFLGFATGAVIASGAKHRDLLPKGHPMSETSSKEEKLNWILSDKSLPESHKDAITAALEDSEDELRALHSSTRLRALLASGAISNDVVWAVDSVINPS